MASKGFPLEFGKRATAGTFENIRIVRCLADGDLSIEAHTGDIATESFVQGEDVELPGVFTVTVVSGDFRLTTRTKA